jgi:excisionase family DNA binding protein
VQHTDLIGTADAARRLGVSRSTLTRRVEAGELEPAMRVPGYRGPLLFERADIEALAGE